MLNIQKELTDLVKFALRHDPMRSEGLGKMALDTIEVLSTQINEEIASAVEAAEEEARNEKSCGH